EFGTPHPPAFGRCGPELYSRDAISAKALPTIENRLTSLRSVVIAGCRSSQTNDSATFFWRAWSGPVAAIASECLDTWSCPSTSTCLFPNRGRGTRHRHSGTQSFVRPLQRVIADRPDRPGLAKALLRLQREESPRLRREAAIHSPQPGETRAV